MKDGWAALVPELSCSDLTRSLAFYVDALGFTVCFERPEDGFAYLERGAAQLMLEQMENSWVTAPLEAPFGRGVNFQIETSDLAAMAASAAARDIASFRELEERWYREGGIEHGQLEWLVQDPDGYLLRFVEPRGARRVEGEAPAHRRRG